MAQQRPADRHTGAANQPRPSRAVCYSFFKIKNLFYMVELFRLRER